MANGSNKCVGSVTRQRITKNRKEESCIDIVLFSSDLSNNFNFLYIDEERKHVLTRIRKTKTGIKTKESDHNVLVTKFDNTISYEKVNKKIEVYNIKNKDCQEKFKQFTSNIKMLSTIFDSS